MRARRKAEGTQRNPYVDVDKIAAHVAEQKAKERRSREAIARGARTGERKRR